MGSSAVDESEAPVIINERNCVFCKICDGEAPAAIALETRNVVAFVPLNPVTPGHLLFVPRSHYRDAAHSPETTGHVMMVAARFAAAQNVPFNLITSAGVEASQSVFHFHVHLVPRRFDDGLALPWTGQAERESR
jgi:histidine triad (HIT) family protein